jgi:hypothetical protein
MPSTIDNKVLRVVRAIVVCRSVAQLKLPHSRNRRSYHSRPLSSRRQIPDESRASILELEGARFFTHSPNTSFELQQYLELAKQGFGLAIAIKEVTSMWDDDEAPCGGLHPSSK